MIEQRQTIFGEGGNCFATCVAMLLDMDTNDVPNFCAEENNWWGKFQIWLVERHLFSIEVNQHTSMAMVPVGTLAILSGPGKRGLLHSVVGEFEGATTDNKSNWLFKCDPHPSDNYIESVEKVCFIVRQI